MYLSPKHISYLIVFGLLSVCDDVKRMANCSISIVGSVSTQISSRLMESPNLLWPEDSVQGSGRMLFSSNDTPPLPDTNDIRSLRYIQHREENNTGTISEHQSNYRISRDSSNSSQTSDSCSYSDSASSSEGSTLLPQPSSARLLTSFQNRSAEEATLLMHYLDYVFFIQFPFYDDSFSSTGRGWLFTLLAGEESTYSATLALSNCLPRSSHIQMQMAANGESHLKVNNKYYTSALRRLQLSLAEAPNWSASVRFSRSLQATTCMLQLIFFEVRCLLVTS